MSNIVKIRHDFFIPEDYPTDRLKSEIAHIRNSIKWIKEEQERRRDPDFLIEYIEPNEFMLNKLVERLHRQG